MRSRSLLDAKQKIFTYNHTSNSLFWNCFSKYTSRSLYLISLAVGKFVGSNPFFFEKIPSYRSLGKGKTVPPFSRITVRKQKEKAAIAAWQSRFDSGFQLLKLCSDFLNHQIQELIYLNEQIAVSRNPIFLF